MRIISFTIEDVDLEGKVMGFSKTSFKAGKKPLVENTTELYDALNLEKRISRQKGVNKYVVSVVTTKGKFIRTYQKVTEYK